MVERHHGHLSVDAHDGNGNAITEPLQLYMSENVPALGAEYKVSSKGGTDDISGTFPTGTYTMQVFAAGYDVYRQTVHLSADYVTRVKVRLNKHVFPKPSLQDRLKVYGLETTQLEPIHVTRGQRLVLDYRKYPNNKHYSVLEPKSISDIKRWVGSPGNAFTGDQPRFGPVSSRDLSAAAREFVYGNSQSVVQFVPDIEEHLLANAQLIFVPIFLFTQVTIDDGATLVIGDGSSVFFADTLTIHPTGTLEVVGSVRSDIGLYQQL